MKKLFLTLVFMFHFVSFAQPMPQTSLVVAFPAGGPADRIARLISDKLGSELNETVIVENRSGASGSIAANHVIRTQSPDNMLFLSNAGVLTINPALDSTLTYSPRKDFKPVSMVADTTTVMVTGAPTDVIDAADFIKRSKTGKSTPSAGSSGVGGASHLSSEMFQESSGIKLLHVPYKGAAPAITDVVGKRVDLFFGDLPGVMGLIESGKLKVLGIAGDKPSTLLPGIRTLDAQGVPGVTPSGWYGVVMPATASDARVTKVAQALKKVLSDPEMSEKLRAMGAVSSPSSPEEFRVFLDQDAKKWEALVQRRNLSISK